MDRIFLFFLHNPTNHYHLLKLLLFCIICVARILQIGGVQKSTLIFLSDKLLYSIEINATHLSFSTLLPFSEDLVSVKYAFQKKINITRCFDIFLQLVFYRISQLLSIFAIGFYFLFSGNWFFRFLPEVRQEVQFFTQFCCLDSQQEYIALVAFFLCSHVPSLVSSAVFSLVDEVTILSSMNNSPELVANFQNIRHKILVCRFIRWLQE